MQITAGYSLATDEQLGTLAVASSQPPMTDRGIVSCICVEAYTQGIPQANIRLPRLNRICKTWYENYVITSSLGLGLGYNWAKVR